MERILGLEGLTRQFPNPVITIGNFDGIHIGHRHLFRQVTVEARDVDGTSMVMTFSPHPLEVLRPGHPLHRLTTPREREALIEECGIDVLVIVQFSQVFATVTPRQFIKQVLVDRVGPVKIIVGRGYRFGRDRAGNVALLEEMGQEFGFTVQVVKKVDINGESVSSTGIRDKVREGDMEGIARHLGRPFSFRGEVVRGRGIGSRLGTPTANLQPERRFLPPDGVYAAWASVEGQMKPAAVYIGERPTFPGEGRCVEVHLLDGEWDLLGRMVTVSLISRLRDDRAFENEAELMKQIQADIVEIRSRLSSPQGEE
jgi:riboflavin kinase/FMN adenylyltransferase